MSAAVGAVLIEVYFPLTYRLSVTDGLPSTVSTVVGGLYCSTFVSHSWS